MTSERTLDLAGQAAEAVRELNHRTRDPRVFVGPAELYRLVGELALLVGGLPQLLSQLDRWLRAEHESGRVRTDTGDDAAPVIASVGVGLADAGAVARDLAHVLDAARQHLAHLGDTEPDPVGGPGRDCAGLTPAWLR